MVPGWGSGRPAAAAPVDFLIVATSSIFEQITIDDGRIVSVTPRDASLPYFQFGQEPGRKERERRDSNPRPPA